MPKKSEEAAQTIAVQYVRHLRLEEKQCPQCGKTFTGVKKQKYCSKACQKKADYERNAETYRAKRMEKYRQQKQQKAKR